MDYSEQDFPIDPSDLLGDGFASDAPGPPPIPPQDPGRRVEPGSHCAGCGYALDGLPLAGVCPECGMPIRRSLAGDLLVDASPDYVKLLGLGALLVLVSLIGSIVVSVGGVLIGIVGAILSATSGAMGLGGAGNSVQVLASLVGFAMSVVGLVGWWLLTTPDPRRGASQQGTARRLVRFMVIFGAAVQVASLVVQVLSGGSLTTTMGPGVAVLAIVVGVLSLAAWVTMFIAEMIYVRGLALRIPDETIERRSRTYVWLLPLIYVLGGCILVGPLVAMVMYLLLINRIRQELRRVLRDQALRYGTAQMA